ncbi:uncharacterized protein LOC117221597 [Megalopta genalis]|uniref:uncharacterized protein LOC117221597 n=1 Tax=Megalopta genalis TaxID=115081 RepID=UPI003FD4762D
MLICYKIDKISCGNCISRQSQPPHYLLFEIFSLCERKAPQDDIDPVEEMLKKTGCMELHYQVQECIAETQDWRKCQGVLKEFRMCMESYQKMREK